MNKTLLVFALLPALLAWENGPDGNAQTDLASERSSPPYSTHDWVADHALMLLDTTERAWLTPLESTLLALARLCLDEPLSAHIYDVTLQGD